MSHDEHHKPTLRGWWRWRTYEWCPGCRCYQDFGPGRVNDDGSAEIRTCAEENCGTQIHTVPYVHTTPAEATVFNLS